MEYAGDILTRRFHAGLVDFTNAGAVAWYQAQMASALNLSFSGWMYDYAEYAPLDCLASDGQRGDSLHNAYPYLYQKAAHDLLVTDAASPYAPDAVFFHRSGDWRSGAVAWAHWTGDAKADWSLESGLPAQVAGCLSSSLSGVAFCGSDIGGVRAPLSIPVSGTHPPHSMCASLRRRRRPSCSTGGWASAPSPALCATRRRAPTATTVRASTCAHRCSRATVRTPRSRSALSVTASSHAAVVA